MSAKDATPHGNWDKNEIDIVEFNYGLTGFDNIF